MGFDGVVLVVREVGLEPAPGRVGGSQGVPMSPALRAVIASTQARVGTRSRASTAELASMASMASAEKYAKYASTKSESIHNVWVEAMLVDRERWADYLDVFTRVDTGELSMGTRWPRPMQWRAWPSRSR